MMRLLALFGALLGAPASAQAPPSAPPPCEGTLTGGGGPPPRWAWRAEAGAPEGRALTEASGLRIADRYPLCILPGPRATDLDVTLRFRPIEGRMDRAGGIAVRLRDANTYYVARANSAEDNVRLYHVIRGRRVQFAGKEGVRIQLGAWHALRLRVEGRRFTVWFDGQPMFEATDDRIAGPGRLALWSIADSSTAFLMPEVEILR